MKKRGSLQPLLQISTLFLFILAPGFHADAPAADNRLQTGEQSSTKNEEKNYDPQTKSSQTADQANTQPAGQTDGQIRPRRIVDPDKIRTKPPLPARILLLPFTTLGGKTEGVLEYFEKWYLQRQSKPPSNSKFSMKPLFGGLGDSTGLGFGFLLSTTDKMSENAKFFVKAHTTNKRYLETALGTEMDPTGGSRKFFSIDFTARYRRRPEEDFFGIGPQSSHDLRSNYNLHERGLNLTANVRPFRHLKVGVGVDYSSNTIFGGRDDRFPATQRLFDKRTLPGLAEGAALLGTFAFAEFDNRENPGNPRNGAYMRFSVTSNDSVGRGDFGYINYAFDARTYIPFWTERRVLALRLLGDFNNPKGGSEIPFFRLPNLGDSRTLRGYDSYRFHDRHALMSSIEYRFELINGIEGLVFTDIGQVFSRRSEFNTKNIHATYGGGLHFKTKKTVFLKILVGKSGEGARLWINFGPTF